jgi:phage gp36-like protein
VTLATVDAVREALNPDGGGDVDLGSAAGMSNSGLQAACDEADAEVTGRIFNRYPTLPAPAPAMVVSIAVDIAAYLATLTFRRGDPIVPGHPVLLRYQRAQALLGQIAAGTMPLVGVETVDAQHASDAEIFNPTQGDMFTPRDVGMRRTVDGSWAPAGSNRSNWPGSTGLPA